MLHKRSWKSSFSSGTWFSKLQAGDSSPKIASFPRVYQIWSLHQCWCWTWKLGFSYLSVTSSIFLLHIGPSLSTLFTLSPQTFSALHKLLQNIRWNLGQGPKPTLDTAVEVGVIKSPPHCRANPSCVNRSFSGGCYVCLVPMMPGVCTLFKICDHANSWAKGYDTRDMKVRAKQWPHNNRHTRMVVHCFLLAGAEPRNHSRVKEDQDWWCWREISLLNWVANVTTNCSPPVFHCLFSALCWLWKAVHCQPLRNTGIKRS